jgi:hypothetical protein
MLKGAMARQSNFGGRRKDRPVSPNGPRARHLADLKIMVRSKILVGATGIEPVTPPV